MSITRLASTTPGVGLNAASTAAINTTGAYLLEATIACYTPGIQPVMSDSKGNTWFIAGVESGAYCEIQKAYAYCSGAGFNGTGHTFTATGISSYIVLMVCAYSSSIPLRFESKVGAGTSSGTSLNTGAVLPSIAGALITTGICLEDLSYSGVAVSGESLAIIAQQTFSANNMGAAFADEVQAVRASINPLWTWVTARKAHAMSAVYIETNTFGPIVQNTPNFGLTINQTIQPYTLTGLNSHIAQLPSGFYVQMLPQFRFVKLKKADGTWVNVFTVFGVLMKMPDGTWEVIGEF